MGRNRLREADERFRRRVVRAGDGFRLIALHDDVKPQTECDIRMHVNMITGDTRSLVGVHDAGARGIGNAIGAGARNPLEAAWRHAAGRLTKVIAVVGERGD